MCFFKYFRSSLNERLEYTDSIIGDIADSADKPLEVRERERGRGREREGERR